MSNKVSFIIQLKDQFGGVADKVSGAFGKMKKNADALDANIRGKLKFSLGDINKQAIEAAKGFAALATVTKTIQIGAAFEDSMAELSAITGEAGAGLREMSADAMRMAKQFGIAQTEVAKAMTLTASAKSELLKTPGAVAKVTAEALRLSKAAGVEIPEAISASIGSLNQWNAGADQAARFVNVLAAGAKVGSSEVRDTAEALKNAGSVAALFNVTFEETNAMLQVLAKNEVKGAEAGTALRGTLSKLEKFAGGRFAPSKIGIIKSLEMIEKLGMSNSKVIKEFGEENLRSILILRSNIPLIKQWTQELTGTAVAGEQAAVRMDTFNTRLAKAGTSLKSIAIKIFDGFEPVLSWLVDKFTFLLNAIEGITSAVGEMLGQTAAAVSNFDFSEFDFSAVASRFGEAFGLDAIKAIKEVDLSAAVTVSPARIAELRANAAAKMAPSVVAPTAPIIPAGGTLNGQIVVSATPGASIKSTALTTQGTGLNLGMNMAGAH